MTVAELIQELEKLPQDLIVYRDVEGECKTLRAPRVADLHTWSIGGSITEDYYVDCQLDEDEAKFKAVIVE